VHKEAAPRTSSLVVQVNLEDFKNIHTISFTPTKARCEEILQQLAEHESCGARWQATQEGWSVAGKESKANFWEH
jgi:hypothetical protein